MSANYAMCKYDDATGSYIPLSDVMAMDFEKWFASYAPFAPESLDDCALAAYQAGAASRDAEIEELLAALESVEWTQLGKMPEGKHCCYCGALEKHGHVTGCKVAISLKRTTLAQALSKVRKL